MTNWSNLVLAAILLASAFPSPARADEEWPRPDPTALPDSPHKDEVLYGAALIRNTHALIGPSAEKPEMHYAGNSLDCSSCHLDAGRQRFGLSYIGVSNAYPRYMARENEARNLTQRINGCLERSMNGRALPENSREIKAMAAYINFLTEAAPANLNGRGSPELPLPARAADPERGREVYQSFCVQCHGANGEGLKNKGGGYAYPPLWGPDSFNTGAGMHRLITAARFIHANMPFGATFETPSLTVEQAFDVAAFINAQPRPEKPGLDRDFPDRSKKPVDAPFPPFADNFPLSQHVLGPYQPIIDARKKAE
ncbi:MAG: c-type cytochrome [Parvularculaceae bacterium]